MKLNSAKLAFYERRTAERNCQALVPAQLKCLIIVFVIVLKCHIKSVVLV